MEYSTPLLLFFLLTASSVQGAQDGRPMRRVASILNAPFLMLREAAAGETLSGNDRYEGFMVDLLDRVSEITEEDYDIYLSPDNKYGARLRNGSWNGVVGEVLTKRADFAAAALTVTYTRSNVIDFGPAFMSSGIQLLYKKPAYTTANMLSPFSIQVWICVIAVFLLAGLGLYFIQRFTQKHTEDDARSALAKCADAYWILIKTFSLQGLSDSAALGLSGRVLLGSWLMFCALTLAMFFAALVAWYPAIIHGIQEPVPFTDSKSLLASGLTFGCVNAGSTKAFFRISSGTVYEKMFYRMESDRSYMRTVADGLEKVREGNFVFIGESLMLEYAASHAPCDLMVVGEHMTSNAYALATPKQSDLKDKLDSAVIQLKERGTLRQLQRKWWQQTSQCSHADAADAAYAPLESIKRPEKVLLRSYVLSGPVIIVCVGMLAAALIAAAQLIWTKQRSSKAGAAETADESPKQQQTAAVV